MTFAGLPWGMLLALSAAVALATIVLYILRLRRRALPVVFAPLWKLAAGERQRSALFSQLKRWLSLLLQLVMLALLLLALGDPRWEGTSERARDIVVIVDASASMKARDGQPTRIDAAKQAVRDLIAGLSTSDRMLIAQVDATVTPLSALSSDVGVLHTAIDAVRASDTAADFDAAFSFASDTLTGKRSPELILVSDGALGDFSERLRSSLPTAIRSSFVPVGRERDNVAITRFSVRRYPLDKSRAEAMLEVSNLMAQQVSVELTLLGDGEALDRVRLELGPGESLPRFYQDLAGVDRTLEATIEVVGVQDWLPADDRAFALVPPRRRATIAVVSRGNTYLEAALLLDEYLDVTWILPGAPLAKDQYDVAILDGVAPPTGLRASGVIHLNPQPGGAIERGNAITDFGFDRWQRSHPVVRFMALESIQVTQGFTLKAAPGDTVIGASELGPILLGGVREGRPFLALGFDPRHSDIVLRPAWPLLLLNAIDSFAHEDDQYLSAQRTGETWRIGVPSGVDEVDLSSPSGREERLAVRQGALSFVGREAGIYRLSAANGAVAWEQLIAANLSNLDESRIDPRATLEAARGPLPKPEGFNTSARHQLWGYLLLAVFALSVTEWLTYHRRISV